MGDGPDWHVPLRDQNTRIQDTRRQRAWKLGSEPRTHQMQDLDILHCGRVLSHPPGGSSAPPKRPSLPSACSFWRWIKAPEPQENLFSKENQRRGQVTFILQAPVLCQSLHWAPSHVTLSHPMEERGSGSGPTGSRGHYLPRILRFAHAEHWTRATRKRLESPEAWGSGVRIKQSGLGSRTYHFLGLYPGQVTDHPYPRSPRGSMLSQDSKNRALFNVAYLPHARHHARLWVGTQSLYKLYDPHR